MKNRRTKGFSFVVLFVIFLMIITVLSWKSCSRESAETGIERNETELVFLT